MNKQLGLRPWGILAEVMRAWALLHLTDVPTLQPGGMLQCTLAYHLVFLEKPSPPADVSGHKL